ncbi:kinetochore-associated protein 1 isoform X2 [Cynoglossus semilaevis]|uniref:kinetochore-associated protein 1 isoform X2 n=1 Tax=Cynoglossus semilaevis TaxID=244447 RepID=UPI000D628467|nr:kinetochore-associated protein 1 isoform X2 [Cynoglossus semilaevis]XP_024909035.1 kinetochore-associated protein 1 isoform X2 [Cynoglossus semilaevis]
MATWSDVELLSSEDTNNLKYLSSDPKEDSGNGLYQVDTLVKISTADEVLRGPRFSSSGGSNWSVVVVDKTVILFDQTYQSVRLLLHFETDVNAIGICLDGQFLLVCEGNGNLHLIYVPQKTILLTRTLVEKPSHRDKKTYLYLIIEEDKASLGMYHVLLVINDGFFHITNLALAKIETAIEKMDLCMLTELQNLIKIDFYSTKDYHDEGCSTAVMFCLDQEIYVLIGGDKDNAITQWSVDHHQAKMCLVHSVDRSLIPGVRKMVVAENLLYVLDTEDVLSLWDMHLLVMIACWPDMAIHDFVLATECGSTSRQDTGNMKMIALSKKDSSQISRLQIRLLPSMTLCYSLDVSSVSCLVQTQLNVDTFYLVEGICLNHESEAQDMSVVVRCFTEALPENRFSRLLHKRMFEEAEKFAITFDLDLELVYKVKLDFVLEQLASGSVGGYGQELWSELVDEAKTNLKKITDEQYIVEYCLKAPWPTFDTAETMLNHAASQYSSLQIHEALARLATFCSLYSTEHFNSIAWIEFLNSTDRLGDVLTYLREGDLNGAQLLWLRFEGEIASEFDKQKLETLLCAIPEDVPSEHLCPWFGRVFVPFVRRVLPTEQKILARWIAQRARNLELMERAAWPQNGLDLAVLGLPSLWTWKKSDESYGTEDIENLRSLVSNLRQLLDLLHKYGCRIKLSDFEKGNIRSIAISMLDKVKAPELIAATVENSILPYAEDHDIFLDELLLQYIKDLLQHCSYQTTTLFAEWEAKAVAVLGSMTDMDLMVDAVLEIMQKAVVPWSNAVENLVQQYLEMDGPKQELLKESYHLMEVRKLLRGYGIRSFNLSDSSKIMTLIRYILKQELPMSLGDALKLGEAYNLSTSQINYLYLVQLIGHGKIKECMAILKKLSSSEAKLVIERLTSWARLQLEKKVHTSEEYKKQQMLVTQVMVEALKYLQVIQKQDILKIMECENNLAMFKEIAHLQDFDVFITPSNFEDPEIRKQIKELHLTTYENTRRRQSSKRKATTNSVVANDPHGKIKTISTEAGLHRLGRQLQHTEQELWSELALRALEVGKVDKALKILSELYEHHYNTNTGTVMFTAAKILCQMQEVDTSMVISENTDLSAVIHNLACQAITVCHPDLLLDCLELCKCTRMAMDVYHQCQLSEDHGFIAEDLNMESEKGPYSQWIFQDVFKEDCIVLDPMSVLPVQYEITNCLLPISRDDKLQPLDCSCLSHCSFADGSNYLKPLLGPLANMLQMLQECTQLELAFRVLVNAYGSCVQHVTSNVMDIKLSILLYETQDLENYHLYLNEILKSTTSSLDTVSVALLNKVFHWRVVDCEFALGLCTLVSKDDVFKILWKVIDNTWKNYDRVLAVAKVGANLCSLYNEAEELEKFLSVITDAQWGIQLGKLDISIQPVFRQEPEMKRHLIPVLLKNKKITPDIFFQYCSTFGLACDSVFSQYITTVLLLQEDEEGVANEGTGQEEMQPFWDEDILKRVIQIIPLLQSTSQFIDSLAAALFKLNPYNYEKIEVVLKIIEAVDDSVTAFSITQATALLQHLKSYKRVAQPSGVENMYLLENNLLPNHLSSSRLPFHLLMQTKHYWKIIIPELSEETYHTLLLISKLMKVSIDKLNMSAANNVFERKMKPLLLEQRKNDRETIKVAKTVMKYIHCIQSPEWAVATAHKITQELPPGKEKTQSLRFCLRLAETWLNNPNLEESARSRVETFLSKLKPQFQRSATVNMLINNKLNSPENLKLSGMPAPLIMALYEHSSVEQRYRASGGQTYPDIHMVVKEIAAANNVNLMKIRNMMLEKWICKTDCAVTKDIVNQECVGSIEEDPDLMRVVYMLSLYPMDEVLRLLSPILSAETWPLNDSNHHLTLCHRTRALLCLIHLVDAETLEAQLQIPRTKIQYYVTSLIFVSRLEALSIPYTVQSFLGSPKEALIKGLWKNHSHLPQGVHLVADLCLEYQVYDHQLWNSLLHKMLSFNLINHLQKVLVALVAVPALWEITSFSRTWKSVILAPFASASVPLSPDQQATLYRTFVFLLKYPFLLDLDLIGIANHFAQFNLSAFALGTLLLIPCASKKDQQIKGFLSVCNPLSVLDQVDELMNTGELAGIPSQVRDRVLSFVNQSGQRQKLMKTKHFKHLEQLVVSNDQPNQGKDLVGQINYNLYPFLLDLDLTA